MVKVRWTLMVALVAVACDPAERGPDTGVLGTTPGSAADLEEAGFEDYRTPVGRLDDDGLNVTLEARAAVARPWGPTGPEIRTHVFAADDAAPRVPGPLIRVRAGTTLRVTLRNAFDHPMVVRGLRRGVPPVVRDENVPAPRDSVLVPARGEAELRATPTVPGTYIYFGQVLGPDSFVGDRAMIGVLLVDPGEGEPPEERIFMITNWGDPERPTSYTPSARFFMNGRSWPHTERLRYTRGDTVRWRVLNMSSRAHPMHLHGSHFRVDARGGPSEEEVLPSDERRTVVTETLQPGETMRLAWVADEPGNWLFHCHLMRHMSWTQGGVSAGEARDAPPSDGTDLMGGMVLGITVTPGEANRVADPVASSVRRLHIGMDPGVFGDEAGYGFVLQEGPEPPSPDSVRFPGSPIVLTRDETAEIRVFNNADVALGVHWHGLEVRSRADGVPGWSGPPGSPVPAIQPGDSLAVRITPPRAGTFMYHVHGEPGHQLAQGLYGAFLVVEPGEVWEPERDLAFVLGSLGSGAHPQPAINGERAPDSVELEVEEAYRLRFMHISPDDEKRVTMLRDGEPVTWGAIAKDGADLPPALARQVLADMVIHVGETYDFRWIPGRAGTLTLRVITTFDGGAPPFTREVPPPDTVRIPVTVG